MTAQERGEVDAWARANKGARVVIGRDVRGRVFRATIAGLGLPRQGIDGKSAIEAFRKATAEPIVGVLS
jgi:hypothetical protein